MGGPARRRHACGRAPRKLPGMRQDLKTNACGRIFCRRNFATKPCGGRGSAARRGVAVLPRLGGGMQPGEWCAAGPEAGAAARARRATHAPRAAAVTSLERQPVRWWDPSADRRPGERFKRLWQSGAGGMGRRARHASLGGSRQAPECAEVGGRGQAPQAQLKIERPVMDGAVALPRSKRTVVWLSIALRWVVRGSYGRAAKRSSGTSGRIDVKQWAARSAAAAAGARLTVPALAPDACRARGRLS